jgi:hypothetical protein
MIRAAWSRVRAWFGASDDESCDDPSAFSLLDASINYSHGQSDGKAVRELQRANEHANELEDARREQR